MGRKPKKKELAVWMNDERVGIWTVTAQGVHEFRYSDAWKESPSVRPLSLSMPIRAENVPYRGDVVEFYFDNLLPNSVEIRKRVQSRFGIFSSKPFDLLREIGRDCVGAVQLLPEGELPSDVRHINGEALSEREVEGVLLHATSGEGFFGDNRDFRISIAGAQEKTALLRHNNGYGCLRQKQTS
jgi:serine/threonine-protein kinase HipA